MTYISFYRKWRPQSFDDIIGQDYAIKTLENAVGQNRLTHSYIFCGPRGTGKTSTARILAKAINCEHGPTASPCNECENCISISRGSNVDVIEIDAASNRGINEIRELREKVKYIPNKLRKKVYIIDEVHMLTKEAFNALLKVLEEPPAHVMFVLATTEPHKVLPTILSRCQRFDFFPIPIKDIEKRLKDISEKENIQIEDTALGIIAKYADGSLRDADGILEQLASFGDGKIGIDEVTSILGVVDYEMLFEFTNIIAEKDLSQGLFFIQRLLESNQNLNLFVLEFLDHLYNLYVYKNYSNPSEFLDVGDELKSLYSSQANRVSSGQLEFLMDLYSGLYKQIKWGEGAKTFFKASFIKALSYGKKPEKERPKAKVEAKEPIPSKKKKQKKKEVRPQTGDPVKDNWDKICNVLKEIKVSVHAKFMETTGYSIDGKKILFYLGENNKWHEEQLNRGKNRKIVSQALKKATGNDYMVKFGLRGKEEGGMISLENNREAAETDIPVEEKEEKKENVYDYFKEKFEIKE